MAQPAFEYEDFADGTEISRTASSADLDRAFTSAAHGKVIYLTDERHRRVSAIVPLTMERPW